MELSGQSQRWQGQRSAFSWEQSALDHIKGQMPDAEPYRAWQTFTFTGPNGHVREDSRARHAAGQMPGQCTS